MCAQVQQMAGIATHTAARAARFGKGCNKEHGHWLPCPKGCFAKAAFTVLQMLAGQVARFCSVFRTLRLATAALAKQGTRCEDFEQALRRLLLAQNRLPWPPFCPACPASHRPNTMHAAFSCLSPALAPNQHGSAGMNHPHTTHSAQTVRNAHGCFLRVYGRLLLAGRTCPVRSP